MILLIETLLNDLQAASDPERARQMSAYMRDQFDFLGIQAALRREITAPFIRTLKQSPGINWDFLTQLFDQPYRECQYIGCDYLNAVKDRLAPSDLDAVRQLAITKSWWDTVDSLDKVIGHLTLAYPKLNVVMLEWSRDQNIWLRRIAINHQRNRKDNMDTVLLEAIILANLDDKEFFINKAIGWILRDYSKTNPHWVSQFIQKHESRLHPLSVREASKYLNQKN